MELTERYIEVNECEHDLRYNRTVEYSDSACMVIYKCTKCGVEENDD